MHFFRALSLWTPFACFVLGDPYTFTIGDPNSYTTSIDAPPGLTGTAVAVDFVSSSTAGAISAGGVNVILSPDLQKATDDAYNAGCTASEDTSCITSLIQVLDSSPTELQTRAFPLLAVAAFIVALAGIIIEIKSLSQSTKAIHVPLDEISELNDAATATEIALAHGTSAPFVTITPTPTVTPTTLTTPDISVSTAATSANGQNPGDVVITLPEGLASRMNEIIARSCVLNKRGDLGTAICAANSIILNSQPAGALKELLLAEPVVNPEAALNLHWILLTVNDGADQVKQYAEAMAPVLSLPIWAAGALGLLAFALVYIEDLQSQGIAISNTIAATALDTTTATTTQCSVTSCLAGCEMYGGIQACSTYCSSTRASSGCNTSPTIYTTAFLNIKTGPKQTRTESSPPPTCFLTTTTWDASYGLGTAPNTWFQCGATQVDIIVATSGTVTTMYPAMGSDVPAGFARVTPTPAPTTTPPPPPSETSTTTAGAATNVPGSCNPTWCGAPFCTPACEPAGSRLFRLLKRRLVEFW